MIGACVPRLGAVTSTRDGRARDGETDGDAVEDETDDGDGDGEEAAEAGAGGRAAGGGRMMDSVVVA